MAENDIQALQEQIKELQEAQKQDRELIALLVRASGNGTQQTKSGRGGRHAPQHVLDTKTNKVYRTKAEAGIAVAPEFGLKIHNFVWYELIKGTKNNPAKCPNRFKVIDEETFQRLLAKQETTTPPEQKPKTPQGQRK